MVVAIQFAVIDITRYKMYNVNVKQNELHDTLHTCKLFQISLLHSLTRHLKTQIQEFLFAVFTTKPSAF